MRVLCFKLSKCSESLWWERWRPKMTKKNSIIVILPMILQKFENNLNPSLAIFFFDVLFRLDLQYNRSSWCHAQTVLVYSKALKTATAHNSPIIYRRFDFWRRRILWFIGFKDNYYIIPLKNSQIRLLFTEK